MSGCRRADRLVRASAGSGTFRFLPGASVVVQPGSFRPATFGVSVFLVLMQGEVATSAGQDDQQDDRGRDRAGELPPGPSVAAALVTTTLVAAALVTTALVAAALVRARLQMGRGEIGRGVPAPGVLGGRTAWPGPPGGLARRAGWTAWPWPPGPQRRRSWVASRRPGPGTSARTGRATGSPGAGPLDPADNLGGRVERRDRAWPGIVGPDAERLAERFTELACSSGTGPPAAWPAPGRTRRRQRPAARAVWPSRSEAARRSART